MLFAPIHQIFDFNPTRLTEQPNIAFPSTLPDFDGTFQHGNLVVFLGQMQRFRYGRQHGFVLVIRQNIPRVVNAGLVLVEFQLVKIAVCPFTRKCFVIQRNNTAVRRKTDFVIRGFRRLLVCKAPFARRADASFDFAVLQSRQIREAPKACFAVPRAVAVFVFYKG